jgi:hypothetical protein
VKDKKIRYLSREEVEKIIRKGLKTKIYSLRQTHYISDKSLDDKISAICNLAYDRDRIRGILEEYKYEILKPVDIELILIEIIEGEK